MKIRSNEAVVSLLKRSNFGKFGEVVVRRKGKVGLNFHKFPGFTRFYLHKIAWLLFPEHFFNPVGQTVETIEGYGKLYSKPKFADSTYVHYVKHFYDKKSYREDRRTCLDCIKHNNRIKDALPMAATLVQAGLPVNTEGVNVGFRAGKPIFYEFQYNDEVDLGRLKSHIPSLSNEKTKRSAFKLLERFEKTGTAARKKP